MWSVAESWKPKMLLPEDDDGGHRESASAIATWRAGALRTPASRRDHAVLARPRTRRDRLGPSRIGDRGGPAQPCQSRVRGFSAVRDFSPRVFCACVAPSAPMTRSRLSPVNGEAFAPPVAPDALAERARPARGACHSPDAGAPKGGVVSHPRCGICSPPIRPCSRPCCRSSTVSFPPFCSNKSD